jgi:hypothetical protein
MSLRDGTRHGCGPEGADALAALGCPAAPAAGPSGRSSGLPPRTSEVGVAVNPDRSAVALMFTPVVSQEQTAPGGPMIQGHTGGAGRCRWGTGWGVRWGTGLVLDAVVVGNTVGSRVGNGRGAAKEREHGLSRGLPWMMMSTVHLPDELVDRLAAEAARRGVSVDELAAETLAARFPQQHPDSGPRRHLAFVAFGASGQPRGGAQADELLAEGFGRD